MSWIHWTGLADQRLYRQRWISVGSDLGVLGHEMKRKHSVIFINPRLAVLTLGSRKI